MKTAFSKVIFLCPECGCRRPAIASLERASSPEPGMRRGSVCAGCGFEIPAHLAERWGGISAEEARKEWLEVYRYSAKHERL